MGRKLLILNERDARHPWAGGAELNVTETAKRWARCGYEPVLLCTRFPGAARQEMQDGMRVRRFGNRLTYYLMLPFIVRQEVRTPGTVIIEHLNKLPFCTALYTRVPIVGVAHHLFGWTAVHQVSLPVAMLVVGSERLVPWLYRRRPMVAVSPSTRDDLIRRGVPPEHIAVIPNGLDHSHYVPAPQPPPAATVLVFGRIEPYKRIDLVLHAMQRLRAQVPAAQLVVVGSGRGLEALRRLATDLGVADRVTFTGFVDEHTKLHYIQQAAVVVNTSEKEGWGLTVLEANACGVPAVASDVPGLRDAVRADETGLLVPHGDVEQLTAAIARLLTVDTERQRLAAGARAWSLQFSWERSMRHLLDLIEATCESSRWPELIPTLDLWAPPRRVPSAAIPSVRRGAAL
jgi:glycosyltransferase involved in cell wall biosynthesis